MAVCHSGRMNVPEPADIAQLATLHVERNILYGQPFRICRTVPAEIRNNCVWNNNRGPVRYDNVSLADYETASAGKATGNLVADPGFVDVARKDFRLKPDSPAFKVGFKPFDYTQAGVYGDKAWIEKGRNLPCPPLEWALSPIPDPILADFEADPVGSRSKLPMQYGSNIQVADEAAENSKHSLRLGQGTYGWKFENCDTGIVRTAFSLRVTQDASMFYESRNSEGAPVFVRFQISGGKLLVDGKPPIELPIAGWMRFEVTSPLGDQATGKWDLSLTLPGEKPQQFKALPCTSTGFPPNGLRGLQRAERIRPPRQHFDRQPAQALAGLVIPGRHNPPWPRLPDRGQRSNSTSPPCFSGLSRSDSLPSAGIISPIIQACPARVTRDAGKRRNGMRTASYVMSVLAVLVWGVLSNAWATAAEKDRWAEDLNRVKFRPAPAHRR